MYYLQDKYRKLLGWERFILYFCTSKHECTRSSMDRIPDSGSDDMSSILIGCTFSVNADCSLTSDGRFFLIVVSRNSVAGIAIDARTYPIRD